jgi:hypothetical protein
MFDYLDKSWKTKLIMTKLIMVELTIYIYGLSKYG